MSASCRRLSAGAWLGLLAIALHAFSPLLGSTLYGATSAPAPRGHDHAAHPHQHGPPDTVAEHSPAAPDLVCVGDCPCCSLGDRPLLFPTRWPVVLLPADPVAGWQHAALPAPHVYHPGTPFPPRAPPASV